MNIKCIDPFVNSARLVLEQFIPLNFNQGEYSWVDELPSQHEIYIKIGLTGQLSGHVLYGLEEQTALHIVSFMMGGLPITQLDEIGRSAISELGNMISGNAGVMLANQGVIIDITPPVILTAIDHLTYSGKAVSVPLHIEKIGEIGMQFLINKPLL